MLTISKPPVVRCKSQINGITFLFLKFGITSHTYMYDYLQEWCNLLGNRQSTLYLLTTIKSCIDTDTELLVRRDSLCVVV